MTDHVENLVVSERELPTPSIICPCLLADKAITTCSQLDGSGSGVFDSTTSQTGGSELAFAPESSSDLLLRGS